MPKTSKAIGIGVAILFIALWARPLVRAVSFFRWAQQYFAETGSINASNDLRFSTILLLSYSISLLSALIFAWFLFRRPRFAFLLPFSLLIFAVSEVIRSQPESPIILFPTFGPWRPVLLSIVAVGLGAFFHHGLKFGTKDKSAQVPSAV